MCFHLPNNEGFDVCVCVGTCTACLHSHIYVIPAFTWTLSLGILLAQAIIQPITSLLTFLKGLMLIVTVRPV